MRQEKKPQILILIIAVFILACQVFGMMKLVNSIQGNGRVVNYAGIVRGATQRLIKNELYGNENDSEIERLDDILLGLQTGKGSQNLTVLEDDTYQENLSTLIDKWTILKETIYLYRKNPSVKSELFSLSETYFTKADLTVSAAEKYSDGIAKKLNILEITISITICIIFVMFFGQIIYNIHNTRKLKKIAYIDSQTGLPNKRSCEEKINDIISIKPGQKICCIMFDLNNLKVANDTYGHAVGDALIISFASLLRRTMPKDMFIGRLGGDEFIGIQLNANEDDVCKKIEELKNTARMTTVDDPNHQILISFSYGYAFSNDNYDCSIKSLLDIADKKMYQYKKDLKAKTDQA